MRKLAVLVIGLLGLTLLVGCDDDNDDHAGPGRSSMATVAPMAPPPSLREGAPAKGDTGGTTVQARKEVITGSVDITADDPIKAGGQVTDQVREVGGRVDSRTEQPGTDDNDPQATLTVRVPADKTDKFIDGLGGVGRVTRMSTNRDDVTMQWEDLDARIKALQASVDRLRTLIAGATNTADLIAAEQALSSRQGELDSLTAQKRHLDDQVALSTLTIDITTEDKDSDEGPTNFWDGIVSGWHSLVDWLKDAVVFTGKAIPWLGFVVVIAAVVWGVVRMARSRKRSSSETGESEEGKAVPVAVGASTGADTTAAEGAGAGSSAGAETGAGAVAGSGAGAGTRAGAGTDAGAGTRAGAGTGAGAETGAGAGKTAGAGQSAGAGTGAGSGTGAGTETGKGTGAAKGTGTTGDTGADGRKGDDQTEQP
ncbi:DUF4349 domain-containing protein [Nocardia sp. NPDC050412]|uniref:DUF4349 domain-containing protein n=1 Tax=Nocardia sp. NPDC050412 TaxID=3364320 RepID=UPI003799B931